MDFNTIEPSVRLVALTQPVDEEFGKTPEDLISYCARVSNPANQQNFETAAGLLAYCRRKRHWSVFEMSNMVLEIRTTRDIGRQILRHRSFAFQEFSQRYAEVTDVMHKGMRLQDKKNRQNSLDTASPVFRSWWKTSMETVLIETNRLYRLALKGGGAKEVARSILPEGLMATTMFMNGTVRNWYHYSQLRTELGTQQEHREIAEMIQNILWEQFPAMKPTAQEQTNIEKIYKILMKEGNFDTQTAQQLAVDIARETG